MVSLPSSRSDDHSNWVREMKGWLDQFHPDNGYPKKAVSLVIPKEKLIVQYEPEGGMPNIGEMRRRVAEMAFVSGTGMVIAGGVAMIIGRTLLGGVAGRIGVAGAFGAVGLAPLLPVVMIGGAVAGVGYTAYKLGKNRSENQRSQAFGQELSEHLRLFYPSVPAPIIMTIVASEDRKITIIYDPDLEPEQHSPQP